MGQWEQRNSAGTAPLVTARPLTRKELSPVPQHPSIPLPDSTQRTVRLFSDDELRRHIRAYERSLALIDDEITAGYDAYSEDELSELHPLMAAFWRERGATSVEELRQATREYYEAALAVLRAEEQLRRKMTVRGFERDGDRFSRGVLDDLRARLNLAGVIERHGFIRLGGQHGDRCRRGPCPFCCTSERSQALAVYCDPGNPADQAFHCFACGAHGDVFTVYELLVGGGFPVAVQLAANFCGVDVRPHKPAQPVVAGRIIVRREGA